MISTEITIAVLIPAIMGNDSAIIPQIIRITAQRIAKPVTRFTVLLRVSADMRPSWERTITTNTDAAHYLAEGSRETPYAEPPTAPSYWLKHEIATLNR